MLRAMGRIKALDLPGERIGRNEQDDEGQSDKKMGRKLQDMARMDQNEDQSDQETDYPSTVRIGPLLRCCLISGNGNSAFALRARVIDAVRQPKIRNHLDIEKRIVHRT